VEAAVTEQTFRLLDEKSSATTIVFWVKNEADANDPAFINAMLLQTMRGPERTKIPVLFSLALSNPRTNTTFGAFPSPEGGWELQIRCETP